MNANELTNLTKRKLDYQAAIESSDRKDDMFQLTPNILNETSNRILNDEVSRDKSGLYNPMSKKPLESNKYEADSPSSYQYDSTVEKDKKETPHMIISMERKKTPSSYYKDSDNSECSEEVDSNPDDTQNQLRYDDIVTDQETKEFLDHYFEDTPTQINIVDFIACLRMAFEDIIKDSGVTDEQFKDTIIDKLEKSDEILSFNKLQARTKDIGLSAYIENLANELYESNQHKQKQQNMEAIFVELDAVRQELVNKEEDLKHRESQLKQQQQELNEWSDDLQDREQQIVIMYQDSKTTLQDDADRMTQEAEMRFKKLLKEQSKKLQTLERDYQNKVRVINSKLRTLNNAPSNMSMRSANMSTVLKSSKNSEDPLATSKKNNEKLKARISNLEKSYEVMKTKCQTYEEQLEKERNERNKYQEDYYKIKSKKEIMSKENKDLITKVEELQAQLKLAQEQVHTFENESSKNYINIKHKESPKSAMKTQDLDDSEELDDILDLVPQNQNVEELNRKLKESAGSKKSPKKSKSSSKQKVQTEVVFAKGSTEEANLFLSFNNLILETIEISLPSLLCTNLKPEYGEDDTLISIQPNLDTDVDLIPKNLANDYSVDLTKILHSKSKNQISLHIGQLLYPNYSQISCKLTESIII